MTDGARTPRGTAVRAAAGAVAVAALWAALAGATHRRNAAWVTQEALFADAVAKSPRKPRPYLSLGYAYRAQGRYPEAIRAYEQGLEHAGGDVGMELQLLRNLGAALIWSNRYDEAVAALERAYAKAPADPEILTNLAVVWLAKRNLALASLYARQAIAAGEAGGSAWNVLGVVQMDEGELAEARASLERAIALDPDAGVRHYNLGKVLDRQGEAAAACAAWRRALAARLDVVTRPEVAALAGRRRCPP